jgi:hypothetical protein
MDVRYVCNLLGKARQKFALKSADLEYPRSFVRGRLLVKKNNRILIQSPALGFRMTSSSAKHPLIIHVRAVPHLNSYTRADKVDSSVMW